ncbi:hypothetical protein FHS55_000725 [Angulomicrobium tetraedrale]|uniref:Integrase DNA-binding domain-containing protein n=1 Tax=Ancylobacter tetraedralis TaxID=217068 RepID=A0A839Z3E0_9HYPH|nr:Arm DNA-binding domain-containing protein [Ancylobacter tetraedralis]MBB3770139.1 hypothetical protein [Ancylobacter tetraedralis]
MGELTDKELKNLKPKAKLYKVTDRDGMHAAVTPTGVISFRCQYRVNGRQEVLTIGRFGAEAARKLTRAPDALEFGMEVSLAEASEVAAGAGSASGRAGRVAVEGQGRKAHSVSGSLHVRRVGGSLFQAHS